MKKGLCESKRQNNFLYVHLFLFFCSGVEYSKDKFKFGGNLMNILNDHAELQLSMNHKEKENDFDDLVSLENILNWFLFY